jgi:hypothetical protein
VCFLLVAPAVLALACFLLVASAPEPILHGMNDGVRPAEEHGAGDSVRSPGGRTLVCFRLVASAVLVVVCFLLVAPAVLVSCASCWSRPRRSRSCAA